jgi:hypothetical protein
VRAAALTFLLLIGSSVALAQPGPASQTVLEPPIASAVEARSATWPIALGVHALIGVEPHTRGSPVAFGAGTELLWKARIGGFAELLSSEGTPVVTPNVNNIKQPSFGDRISVPFGLALRPLAWSYADGAGWWSRLATGLGLQVGVTVEHVRTSDDSATTAGLHAALGLDVPLYGGPKQGGVGLRLYGRMIVTPAIQLDFDTMSQVFTVFHPIFSGQLFAGLVYYP